MAHILRLDARPRGAHSISRTLTKEFVSDWKAAHSNDTTTYRDIGYSVAPNAK